MFAKHSIMYVCSVCNISSLILRFHKLLNFLSDDVLFYKVRKSLGQCVLLY